MKQTKPYESPTLCVSALLGGTLLSASGEATSFTFEVPFDEEVTF